MAPYIQDDEQSCIIPLTTHNAAPTPKASHGNPAQASPDMRHAAAAAAAAAAAECDNPDDISIALEWKLLLPLLLPGASDPQPSDGRPILRAATPSSTPSSSSSSEQPHLAQAFDSIAQTIRTAGGERAVTAHALARDRLEERAFWASAWVVKKANSALPLAAEQALAAAGYVWVPVEICSPRMRFRDPQTRARVGRVLGALSQGHRLTANCTCEVHVHLGRMDGAPWALETLKRLGALLWVAEPTLRSIRDPGSLNFGNVYTWGFPMRQHSRLAKRVGEVVDGLERVQQVVPDMGGVGLVQGMMMTAASARESMAFAEIWNTRGHLELGQLLSGSSKTYRRLGFNFSAFGEEDERAKRNPRTVEFRMMDGSVSTDLIMGWLAICGTIAEAAVAPSNGRFAAALGVSLQRSDGLLDESETLGERRGREFRELMHSLGVAEPHFHGFEEKIRREHTA